MNDRDIEQMMIALYDAVLNSDKRAEKVVQRIEDRVKTVEQKVKALDSETHNIKIRLEDVEQSFRATKKLSKMVLLRIVF
jgi:chaperonin cofactor prefoldin